MRSYFYLLLRLQHRHSDIGRVSGVLYLQSNFVKYSQVTPISWFLHPQKQDSATFRAQLEPSWCSTSGTICVIVPSQQWNNGC